MSIFHSLCNIFYTNLTLNYTDCVPQCKFGVCNTTIGKCICPPGHTGADCSVISMLLFIGCVCIRVCIIVSVFLSMYVYGEGVIMC